MVFPAQRGSPEGDASELPRSGRKQYQGRRLRNTLQRLLVTPASSPTCSKKLGDNFSLRGIHESISSRHCSVQLTYSLSFFSLQCDALSSYSYSAIADVMNKTTASVQ